MGRKSKEVKAVVAELEAKVGNCTTDEQVAAASRFNAGIRVSNVHHRVRENAWEYHLQKNCGVDGRGRVWAEIMLYRATGHISSYFVSQSTPLENGAIDELDVCAVAFLRLAYERRLPELEEVDGIQLKLSSDTTIAESFKNYMDAVQAKKSFESWDYKHIIDMRYKIYQVLHKCIDHKKRMLSPSAEDQTPSKKVFTSTPGSELVRGEQEIANLCASAASASSNMLSNYSPYESVSPTSSLTPNLSLRQRGRPAEKPHFSLFVDSSSNNARSSPASGSLFNSGGYGTANGSGEGTSATSEDKPKSSFFLKLEERLTEGRACRDTAQQRKAEYEAAKQAVEDASVKQSIHILTQGTLQESCEAIKTGREQNMPWDQIFDTVKLNVAKKWGESCDITEEFLGYFSLLMDEKKAEEVHKTAERTYQELKEKWRGTKIATGKNTLPASILEVWRG